MAVSGRASSDIRDSISKGSTEDFDVCCDPCSTAGRTAEANGFCTNCQENLCKTCLDAHKGTKASKHHEVLGEVQTKPTKGTSQQDDKSPPCTEPCQIHQTEVIKFFCPTHDAVGCNDCMTLDHRTCSIKYIPDICAGSREFKTTLQEVAKAIEEEKDIIKSAQAAKAGNKTGIEGAILEVEIFQKKLNDKIEHLKRTMIQEAQTERSSRDTHLDQILKTVLQDSTELKRIQSTMSEGQTKLADARAFTTLKQAQAKLKALKSQSFEKDLSGNKIKCIFQPNKVLKKALSSIDGLGKLIMLTDLGPLIPKNHFIVRTETDTTQCHITGCAFISASRLILADYNNKKLKILDIDRQSVVEEKTLGTEPFDIAILPQNQVAVSLPFKEKIQILSNTSKLTKFRSIPVKRNCCGMVYHQDLLYVVCRQPNSLLVLDMQIGVQRDVTLQAAMNVTFQNPLHIAGSHDGQHLYISDWKSNFVASITLQGKVTGVYKNDEMKYPRGLLVMPGGSLLVCCGSSGTIHHVSSDLKKGLTKNKKVTLATSICYQPDKQTIFVGSQNCDHIKVFAEK